jgi:hypothetical protein
VVRCGSKSMYHEDKCLNKNELRVKILLTTLHSIVHTIGGPTYSLEESTIAITISKSGVVRFSIRFLLMLHHRCADTQKSQRCKSNQ